VSRGKGNAAPSWVAVYLHPWFPDAVKTPNGRPGRDLENTVGMAIEVKTGAEWRPNAWIKQAAGYATELELPVLLYLPPGMGETRVGDSMAILPLRLLMPLAVAAGYAPHPSRSGERSGRGERQADH
jgi:hypothetical protein